MGKLIQIEEVRVGHFKDPNNDEKSVIKIYQALDEDGNPTSYTDMATILTEGLSLLIRAVSKEVSTEAGTDLMKQIHRRLEDNFISIESYEDAYLNEKHKTDI